MDWINTLNGIKDKLKKNGYEETTNRIIGAQMILGTPGEMYIEVMNLLLELRNNSINEYQLIEEEVTQLLEYGKSLNYYHPTL